MDAEVRRALLVDPDPVRRRLLARDMRARGVTAVAEAGSVAEAREVARRPGARDLAVVDVDHGADSWELVQELGRIHWATVVVTTASSATDVVVAALSRGAKGVLLPARDTGGEAPAVNGEPDSSRATVATRSVLDANGSPQWLSARELQILQHAADGLTNFDIAQRIDLSPLTVKSHLSRVARRLGCSERAQLVLLALRAGVIR